MPWRSRLAGLRQSIPPTNGSGPIFVVEHFAPRIAGIDHAWPWHWLRGSVLYAVPGG